MRTAAPITLTEDDQAHLSTWVHRGPAAARIQPRARILLQLGEGWRDVASADALDVGVGPVRNTRQRSLTGGLEAVVQDQRQARARQALTGEQVAHLSAIACSPAPKGHAHWTLRLLASKAVELGLVSGISPETIRQALKKTTASPGSTSSGACPAWAPPSSRRWQRSSTAPPRRRIPSSR
jgi:hypothetical protein